jgi:UDP-GlcNAc:undecaprenyl-phosphate GlcNAc-1-phosphate transferase
MNNDSLLFGLISVVCSALLAYSLTPVVRVLAYRIGAIDVPADARRMHKVPIPRLGGLAIYAAFCVTTLLFCTPSPILYTVWIGGLILCVLGTLDDVFRLHWALKLVVQFLAAGFAVAMGVVIDQINVGGQYVSLGMWSIPLTILWIVGLTNAINFLDGLDGLACGISTISCCSLVGVMLVMGDVVSAIITAILIGACIGFLPFNRHPARIFMGDTGALFLGFTLSVISVEGVFKLHMLLSFAIPLIIFALPVFDTTFAIARRLLHKKSPFTPDRGHLHHRLIDLGFTQKEAVGILYAICGIVGLVAVTLTDPFFKSDLIRSLALAAVAIAVFVLNFLIMKNPAARAQSGLFRPESHEDVAPPVSAPDDAKAAEKYGSAAAPDGADPKEPDDAGHSDP